MATSRPLTGAEEFDRRRRSLSPVASAPQDDPLAELARLVGHDDPFRGLPPQIRPVSRPRDAAEQADRLAEFPAFDAFLDAQDQSATDIHATDLGAEPGTPDDPAVVHPLVGRPAEAERYPAVSVRGERGPDLSSDAWARGAPPAVAPMAAVLTATRDRPADPEARGSAQRTLIVLAAVVVLTGGGLAASFLAKPSAGMAAATTASATSAPTILAATGPTKVQPETPAADPDSPSEPSTLLDKNKNDGTATAKVVDKVEQPVDLTQAIKPAPAAQQGDDAAAPPSPFPEPRKVKTILVRPDGSVIADRAPSTAVADAVPANPVSEQASLAFDPKTSLPIVGAPPTPSSEAPAAATPPAPLPPVKSQARVAAPKPPVSHDAAADETKPVAAPPHAKPPKPKPVQEADASTAPADDSPVAAASGHFGVQLGAAGSDAEAKDLVTRLGRKYAGDLDGAHPSVHKAQSGDKTVFRVRVGGLSQDAAKAICGKVSAGGGGCFVVRD